MRIFAEERGSLSCVYGAVDRDNQALVNNGMALRYCNEYGNWEEVDLRDCLTFTKSRLISIAEVSVNFAQISTYLLLCSLFQSVVTDENLESVTVRLMEAVTMATTEEDQSADILERITDLVSEIESCTSEDRVSSGHSESY